MLEIALEHPVEIVLGHIVLKNRARKHVLEIALEHPVLEIALEHLVLSEIAFKSSVESKGFPLFFAWAWRFSVSAILCTLPPKACRLKSGLAKHDYDADYVARRLSF